MNTLKRFGWLPAFAFLVSCAPAQTVAPLAPQGKSGEVYYAPFPVRITLDGALEDWRGVPKVTFSGGIVASKKPGEDGPVTFAVAADANFLYCLAEITDRTIVAGQRDKRFWEEDSVEFYLNATGDFATKSYKPGIAQVTIPALNIGKSANEAVIAGINGAASGAAAIAIKTPTGWAVETAIPLKNTAWNIPLEHGGTIGFEVGLNGSSSPTAGQEVKLAWSKLDTNADSNASNNPSVFGKVVLFKIGSSETPSAK